MIKLRHLVHCLALLMIAVTTQVEAMVPSEPTWAKTIIPTGQERATIKSMPIEKRPYRPLHIYGNSVRRRHYHGTAIPLPRGLNNNDKK